MYYEKTYTDGFFNVSGDNGFLPIKEPLSRLPKKFCELQKIIDKLHVMTNKCMQLQVNICIEG